MPPRTTVTGRSLEPRRRYAEELRLMRTQRGESLRQLGKALGWDASLFGKLESGQTIGSPEVAEALDQHYGTPGLLLALWELAAADPTQFKERYRRYMFLESQAVSLWHYAVSVLPGLLQTPGYARALLAAGGLSGDELTRQVDARIGRCEVLNADNPPQFRTILSEAVLRTPLTDADEWRKQLEHLVAMGERPNITIQVVLSEAGPHALSNTDTMFLRLPGGRTAAWVETGYSGELVQESESVERLQHAYDAVRDLALSPADSRKFIIQTLEEVPCEPST
ncbi:putative transcriptional regulator [Streptomyces sp. NBRC 110611]|uniref:helix-turn-helix domain-containing protein n=1 Tax=Streptomyces sp. NBRC 110611 TaxID=1621259 RepID=UPI00082A49A5|nr:helix-turn-helix transcriptional regulator [Streptomyces sp. NBRC 110611]GAU68907.1 putative transcriptional regulator [Streptomyces sp. NBRC 110611]